MRRAPTVSVAICLYNRAALIFSALDSVLAQTFQDFEIVIVDDGSTDAGPESIERHYRDPRVRVIRQPHRGLSMTRRATIDASRGEFVAFLDSDDLWHPQKLERQVAAASADESLALVCSDCRFIDEQGRPCGLMSDIYRLADVDWSRVDMHAELLRRGCFVWQSTAMARAHLLRSIDPYDPDYPYVADYDTWLRLSKRHAMLYMPDILASWRVHDHQFTNRIPDIALEDQRQLLTPFFRDESIPRGIRISLGDRLLGQHRVACRQLMRQGRPAAALRAAAGMLDYPDRLLAFVLGAIAESKPFGPVLLRAYKSLRGKWRKWRQGLGSARVTSKISS